MVQYSALSFEKHGSSCLKPDEDYAFAQKQALVPVVGLEISTAAINMPLTFVRSEDSVTLCALLSFSSDLNLFVDSVSGRWLGSYVPAVLRAHPFAFLPTEPGSPDFVLCIDEDSQRLSKHKHGLPLFDASKSLHPQWHPILENLKKLERSRQATQEAVRLLDSYELICPWSFKVNIEGVDRPVSGTFCIDEQKLNALDGPQLAELRDLGALSLAYAQLISMARIDILEKIYRARSEPNRKAVTQLGDEIDLSFIDDLSLN